MALTTEQLATYNAQIEKIEEAFDKEYVNLTLENLMISSHWKIIYSQELNRGEKRLIKGYLAYKEYNFSQGYLYQRIPSLEALTKKIQELVQNEENARWVVRDRSSNLYFSRMIQSPYWDKKSKCFLLSQNDAERIKNAFCKQTTSYRFEVIKIDATSRFNKK